MAQRRLFAFLFIFIIIMTMSACGSREPKQPAPTRQLSVQEAKPLTIKSIGINSTANAQRSVRIQKVINTGMKYLGRPYEFGSNRSTTKTFDCSDFVRQAYYEGIGLRLPADSRQQGMYVRDRGAAKTDWRQLRAGDVMFFSSYGVKVTSSKRYSIRITHDGIYLGNGKIMHTYSKESGGVRIDNIAGTQWERRFLYGGSII